jgi:hypothetical protein
MKVAPQEQKRFDGDICPGSLFVFMPPDTHEKKERFPPLLF